MAAVRRGFQLAAAAGRKCSPGYLLAGVARGQDGAARWRLAGSRLSRPARLFAGRAAWFGSRRAGLRDRRFRLRTHAAYRNAPQP